ncbi:MAG: homocysteine S-methyltransferase family protein, partial [Lachnospiraceae bacterium]|nr:homocysteine S-methyltransferase family protein [Lachnospiraceae bacterium]
PEDFKKYMGLLMDAGADIIGGCCGTTPVYIEGLRDLIREKAR